MALVTVSAVVNDNASFAVGPFGLPAEATLSIHRTSVPGMYEIIYDNVFSGRPVVTVTHAWLGIYGASGGSTSDNAIVNEITKSYTTVKLGNAEGNGLWRPFTIVLTGHRSVAKKPERDDD